MNRRWIGGSVAAALTLSAAALSAPATAESPATRGQDRAQAVTTGYEVWASDQSNTVPGQAGAGVKGSYLWIWDSADIAEQLDGGPEATPLGCAEGETGPCDLLDVFPQDLAEHDASGRPTGRTLGQLPGFGRLHGMLADPQQRYLTANIFAPSGAYVGIIDRRTKGAVALFRATSTSSTAVGRSVHMSFWNNDGSQVIVANLDGKVLERIDVARDADGSITAAAFNRSASLGVGRSQSVTDGAAVFLGANQQGRPLLGTVSGRYEDADFGDLTPSGACKENGCTTGRVGAAGGRPNNLIICPVPGASGVTYITLGGGGLLVADTSATPMSIVGEYGNRVINGAGCGGVQAGQEMWLNAGVSASGAGATQSTFTVYTLDDTAYGTAQPENTPMPTTAYTDAATNTTTGGNTDGQAGPTNGTGQLPGVTTRRDSHGAAATGGDAYVQMGDRIQNLMETFDAVTGQRRTYDLTNGVCAAHAAPGVPPAYADDPAPDLMEETPDGRYLMVALRGPVPVSAAHASQGACPGVGIVKTTGAGRSGQLVDVLRTSNTVDTVATSPSSAPGGYQYTGAERSDVHAATVVAKK